MVMIVQSVYMVTSVPKLISVALETGEEHLDIFINFYHRIRQKIYVTMEHKSSLKSLRMFVEIAKKYILWVKMIDLSFMPKIVRILSKDHVP